MLFPWKSGLAGLAMAAFLTGPSFAGEPVAEEAVDLEKCEACEEAAAEEEDDCSWCKLGEPISLWGTVAPCCDDITIAGWLQTGYHTRSNGLFNSHDNGINLHQAYLYAEKVADGSDGIGFGGRVDVVYGVDAQDTQAFNGEPETWDNPWDNGKYGWAIPQLYGEVAVGDLSVKVGHFYTLIGYEVVTAPDNFFYSHAFTQYTNEPFTHTGALATYALNDCTTLYAGWVDGWDTGFEFSGGNQFLGGISRELNDDMTLTYIFLYGDREHSPALPNGAWGYNHSVVFDWMLSDKLEYVFQSDYRNYNAENLHAYGVNQYLFYYINDCLAVGARAEWLHWAVPGDDRDGYETTFGLNYRPHANVVLRPEVRYDFGDDNFFNGGGPILQANDAQDHFTFGVDLIVTF